MTKIKIELDSDVDLSTIEINLKPQRNKTTVTKEVGSTSVTVEKPEPKKTTKAHGFDANMMDIVNGD